MKTFIRSILSPARLIAPCWLLAALLMASKVSAYAETLAATNAATDVATDGADQAATSPPPSLEKTNPPAASEIPAVVQSDTDLWQRIRRGFAMDPLITPLVENHELWYSARQDYIKRFVERGSKYMYHIVEEVERRNMPTEIVLLPIIESAFNPQANSVASASGMWQFIPSTGKSFGLKQDWQNDRRRDVLMSTDAALDYLQKLHNMFNSWELAFAAYNCGEGCVGRAIAANQRKGLPTDFLSLKLPPETRNYVPKLIAVKNIVLSPASYGIELDSLHNRPYFIKVAAPQKIDMKLAARLAEMPQDDFAALNPAFSKPVAAGSSYFLVPLDKAEVFNTNLELYRSLNGPMVSWQTATARRGESVDKVAKRYGMTGSYLRATNGPFKERKGKLREAITFMVPMQKEAKIIDATFDMKVAMKAAAAQDLAPASGKVAAIAEAAVESPANSTPGATPGATSSPPSSVSTGGASVAIASIAGALTPIVPSTPEMPTNYVVEKGDTLYAVAKRFNLTTEQLKARNSLTGNQLQVGQSLTISSGASMENTVIAPDSYLKKVATGPASVSAAPAAKSYTVRNGDTLFGIAQKSGMSLENLLRINNLNSKSVLQPGKRLKVS